MIDFEVLKSLFSKDDFKKNAKVLFFCNAKEVTTLDNQQWISVHVYVMQQFVECQYCLHLRELMWVLLLTISQISYCRFY